MFFTIIILDCDVDFEEIIVYLSFQLAAEREEQYLDNIGPPLRE